MEIIILIAAEILSLIAIHNYIKVKDLEGRTERTFIEVERGLNMESSHRKIDHIKIIQISTPSLLMKI